MAPVYPAIAKAANIGGAVTFEVTVDVSGHVQSARVISGPPMLRQAALDAVKQWVYPPFVINGKATEKTVRASVNFDVAPPANSDDQQIAEKYFPAFDECRVRFQEPDTKLAVAACSNAAELASSFSDHERFIERRSAYVYAAAACLRDKQFDRGLTYADKAVGVVLQGHDDGSGSNAAYSVRAQCEAYLGKLAQADADLSTAEKFELKAIEKLIKDAPELVTHEYVPKLKGELLFHAQVLDALNHPAEAQAKRQEASKL